MGGRTTQFARTIATLQGVLTGLWPDADVPASFTTASDQGELLYGGVPLHARHPDTMLRQLRVPG